MSNPRIIAGQAKGIRLNDVPGDITRPITDRVKEAMFNIIGTDIYDGAFLDLFGGTGSVGLEALSRGAGWVEINDMNRAAVQVIQANLLRTRLDPARVKIIQSDAFVLLKQSPDRTYDYIFIAPPQYKEMWVKAIQILDAHPVWLVADGWVIIQIDPVEYQVQTLLHFEEFDQRRYGSTLLVFYRQVQPNQTSDIP